MIDYAKITVQAGSGGRGSGSRTQIKGKRYGRADGGDGGRGGDAYFVATEDLNTLEPYRFLKHYEAENGQNGFSNLRRGASGQDLELKVPVGTVVTVVSPPARNATHSVAGGQTPQTSPTTPTLDLAHDGQQVLIARGGQGGRGNAHLRDEYGRRPKTGDPGQEGEKIDLILELKLIADVGLIGLPNAGKSTLLSRLTSATPKIANYPFTTLEPNLGVLNKSVALARDTRGTLKPRGTLVFADIPGLIEGASQGKGLGDLFLRHIERTTLLVHLIDITSYELWENYQTVRSELKNYSKSLPKKKEIIVLNKADLVTKDQIQKVVDIFKNHRKRVLILSAEKAEGLEELVKEILKKLKGSSFSQNPQGV